MKLSSRYRLLSFAMALAASACVADGTVEDSDAFFDPGAMDCVSSDGETEVFFPEALDRSLEVSLALRDATGLTRVTTCDDARLVIETDNAMGPATAEPALAAPEPQLGPSSAGPIVDKILNGENSNDNSVIRFGGGGLKTCSAVQIKDRVLLTAAHCIPSTVAQDIWTKFDDVKVWWEDRNHDRQDEKRDVWAARRSDYGGAGDAGDDVAILWLSATLKDSTSRDVWLDTLSDNQPLRIKGWGYKTDSGTDSGTLRTGDNYEPVYIKERHKNRFMAKSRIARTCSGDSGGPAVVYFGSEEFAVGVLHGSQHSNKCARVDGEMWWYRMQGHWDWIEDRIGACERKNVYGGEIADCG